ncbi:helix-hairpin-helix domain-containing protein [Fodinibius sp. SL11]|uniref:helix-hairpin-helix domain-containing protein n=1 Tax=Fodinibius sp. SL11 TaxID=3425690 RepID=UPI003F8808E9
MRLFWKIVLLAALPIGGYWLYKTWDQTTEREAQPGPTEEEKASYQTPTKARADKPSGEDSNEQIIEELSNIDGVTSRVAENLVKRGIKSKEALMELTEEELRAVKGIGPKRAAKILRL